MTSRPTCHETALDTHSFLWFIAGDARLSPTARSAIEVEANDVLLGIGSLWEMAIKASIGKLSFDQPFDLLIPEQIDALSVGVLPMSIDHLVRVAALPFHHRDPFDRLLIAQALADGLPIVGADAAFDAYGVQRIW